MVKSDLILDLPEKNFETCDIIIMSKKRRREISAVQIQLIEIYDDLANPDEEIRLKAAQNLLLKIDSYTSEQLHEILRRLIRGLCSGRKAARIGFSIALTELQVQLFGPKGANTTLASVSDVIETLDKQTSVGGNVSGQVYHTQSSE